MSFQQIYNINEQIKQLQKDVLDIKAAISDLQERLPQEKSEPILFGSLQPSEPRSVGRPRKNNGT